jgi:hypothetical protein
VFISASIDQRVRLWRILPDGSVQTVKDLMSQVADCSALCSTRMAGDDRRLVAVAGIGLELVSVKF